MGDYRVQAAHDLGPPEIAEITGLLATVAAADGHQPLSESKRIELVHDRRVTALFARTLDDALVGYGHLSGASPSWAVEVGVHPSHRAAGEDLTARLLRAAVDEVRLRGGGRLRYWAAKPTTAVDELAAALGFVFERDLLQLRVPLPLDPAVRRGAAPLAVRPFRPGEDEPAWLAVNNRAFADHPEQGGWDLATLLERERQGWFDPSGFLLHEEDGRLAGSCWTKVHADTEPPLGEIYVISVDPAFHHRGLGRALTIAGLDRLATVSITVGMLYVDAANAPGMALYRSLGFTVDHLDRAYLLEVAPAPGDQTPETPTARPMP